MEVLRRSARWLRALVRWLMQARPVWGLVGVLLLALVGSCLVPTFIPPKSPEDRLRYFGLAFQLLGILTVVRGLLARERLFRVRSLADSIRQWWRRRPRWTPGSHTVIAGTGSIGMAGGEARLSTWQGVPPDADLPARVAALEANVDRLRADIQQHDKDIQAERQQRAEALAAERQLRESTTRDLRTQLEGLGASGIHVEWAGVYWLVVGTVLATIPAEVAGLLRLLLKCVQ